MATNPTNLIMPSLFPIEECDMDRLYEIEQAAHLVPWSLGTLKNNVGERYLNLKLVEKEQVLGFACLLYTSPSPRDVEESRMPSSA